MYLLLYLIGYIAVIYFRLLFNIAGPVHEMFIDNLYKSPK